MTLQIFDVTAAFDGGQVFAELQDAETGLRLGHATMDIRYHAGGYEPAQTVFLGQTLCDADGISRTLTLSSRQATDLKSF